MESAIIKLGSARLKSAITNQIYFKTGVDLTKPIHLHAQLNYKCNSRCVMCDCWGKGLDDYKELDAEIWISALGELKAISPNIKASFAGGEILQKKDVWDIFQYCHENNIIFGITTSGILLNVRNTQKLIDLNPFNVHVSLDSLNEDTYENIRGIRRLSTVKKNITYLMKYIHETQKKTSVTLKTMVCKSNLDELDKIVHYAEKHGVQGVTFQTVFDYIDEAYSLFITDMDKLQHMINKLVKMKKDGYPILNSADNMQSWMDYYERSKIISPRIAQKDNNKRCDISLMNVYVLASGEIKLCELYDDHLGSIDTDNIVSVLRSKKTKDKKIELTRCERNCVYCIKRSAKDYINIARRFVKM